MSKDIFFFVLYTLAQVYLQTQGYKAKEVAQQLIAQ